MLLRAVSASFFLVVLNAAPSPQVSPQLQEIVMPTQSPAEAVREAIRDDPDVAQAVQSNSSQLYLLKTVSLASGTTADLDLPAEEYLPHGSPDRIRENGVTIFSSPSAISEPSSPAIAGEDLKSAPENNSESNILVQLVPVSIN